MTNHFKDTLQIIKTLIKPQQIEGRVEDIAIEPLYRMGYRTIFLDIDNTLVPYSEREMTLQKIKWVHQLQSTGFQVFFVSNNNSRRRVERITRDLDIETIYFALKPLTYSVKELAANWHADLKKSIFIGDKLFTDIILGNWLEAYTILVDPLDKKFSFFRTVQKEIELTLLNKILEWD